MKKPSTRANWYALMVAIITTACVPAVSLQPTQTQSASPAVTASPIPTPPTATAAVPTETLVTPDFVVTTAEFGKSITLTVGQTIALLPPSRSMEWQMTYSNILFVALTAPEKMRSPGPQGWLFRAIAAGQGDFVLTSVVSPCPSINPCSPIPARFSVSVFIQE